MTENKTKSTLTPLFTFGPFCLALFLLLSGNLQIFRVTSHSMEQTLDQGDRVIVLKRTYAGKSGRIVKIMLPIKRNDILAFLWRPDSTDDNAWVYYIKRCVALPGDDFRIQDTKIYCNEVLQAEPEHLQFRYRLLFEDTSRLKPFILQHDNISQLTPHSLKPILYFTDNQFIANKLQQDSSVISCARAFNYTPATPTLFPHDTAFHWSLNGIYGPVHIPKRGDTVQLHRNNYLLYRTIIERFEMHHLEWTDSVALMDGLPANQYVFSKNYYFVLGDNRINSEDSRFWGFLPEELIIGRVVWILKHHKPY